MEPKGPGVVERQIDPERHAALARRVKRQRHELRTMNRAIRYYKLLWAVEHQRASNADERYQRAARFITPFAEVPALYEIAKQVCHEAGISWRDPRTGEVVPPPKP